MYTRKQQNCSTFKLALKETLDGDDDDDDDDDDV